MKNARCYYSLVVEMLDLFCIVKLTFLCRSTFSICRLSDFRGAKQKSYPKADLRRFWIMLFYKTNLLSSDTKISSLWVHPFLELQLSDYAWLFVYSLIPRSFLQYRLFLNCPSPKSLSSPLLGVWECLLLPPYSNWRYLLQLSAENLLP